jgi:hypothetical protein
VVVVGGVVVGVGVGVGVGVVDVGVGVGGTTDAFYAAFASPSHLVALPQLEVGGSGATFVFVCWRSLLLFALFLPSSSNFFHFSILTIMYFFDLALNAFRKFFSFLVSSNSIVL